MAKPELLLNPVSRKHMWFFFPSVVIHFVLCTHTSCFIVGPKELLPTNERHSRPSIHLSGIFMCVYSIIIQSLEKILMSVVPVVWGTSGLSGIPRKIIVFFTKEKRVNKEGRDKRVLCAVRKRNPQTYTVYLYTVAIKCWDPFIFCTYINVYLKWKSTFYAPWSTFSNP